MFFISGSDITVITNVIQYQEPLHILDHFINVFLWRDASLFGALIYLLPMLIGTGQKKGILSYKSVESGYYICKYEFVDLTQMQFCIHIWNCSGYIKFFPVHNILFLVIIL